MQNILPFDRPHALNLAAQLAL